MDWKEIKCSYCGKKGKRLVSPISVALAIDNFEDDDKNGIFYVCSECEKN
jgi:DNA-directed RNA polymerase subunit RPC12/RpoP